MSNLRDLNFHKGKLEPSHLSGDEVQRLSEKQQSQHPGTPSRLQSPMLALQLVMLGFFVALTLNGDYDESRVETVLESVDDRFEDAWLSELDTPQNSSSPLLSSDLYFTSPQQFQSAITSLFRSLLEYETARSVENGRTFELNVPIRELFSEDGETTVQEALLTDRLAQSLNVQPEDNWWFRLLIITHSDQTLIPPRFGKKAANTLLKRLELNGVAPFMLSAGLEVGNTNTLTFRFELNFAP